MWSAAGCASVGPDRRVVQASREVAQVCTSLAERGLSAGRQGLVLVDRSDERLVEVRVFGRQARDVSQHQQRV
jgi:hypothetical protein